MPQTSTIAFALIVGFVVFITVKGELPAYLCVLGIGRNCPQPGQKSSLTTGGASTGSGTGTSGASVGLPTTISSIGSIPPGSIPPWITSNTSVDYSGVDPGFSSGDPSVNPVGVSDTTITYDTGGDG